MKIRNPAENFPPGAYIIEEMQERGWDEAELAERLAIPLEELHGLLAARIVVDGRIAERLATTFNTSQTIWLSLEIAYDRELATAPRKA